MKLKIVSDGRAINTHVETEDGHEIKGVQSIDWHVDVESGLATAEIKFVNIPVDIVGDTDTDTPGEHVDVSALGDKYERAVFVRKGTE